MRQVQAALAGEQELAAHRGHRVVHVYAGAGLGQHLGSHQPGGPAADHGNGRWFGGRGHPGIVPCTNGTMPRQWLDQRAGIARLAVA